MPDGLVSDCTPVVLGYGCRLPGAASPQAFHAALLRGDCAISRIPAERWDPRGLIHPDRLHPGTSYSNAAAILDDPYQFDAAFFGISPREAVQMDPQQRLLLQVAWEAVEMAGLVPTRLRGPRTGVYVGASGLDYANAHTGDLSLADAPFMTGNTLSIIANRLAHVLDAEGPSYVVDTACSSSLYAFHAACRAIRAGEIDIAVVGGTNMLFNPGPFIGFSRAGMISPTGRSRPFHADADGYVRAEGVVAFVLASRAAALAGGDRVRGVIAASGINSDGRARALSVPNGVRQRHLMEACLAEAGLAADDLAFVEAHGTGTAVGDPIEADAIGRAIGQKRSEPLPIGSVKSNIGHLEPASGLAGLLKAQLALEHGTLPATLGVDVPNPHIPQDELNLRLARDPVDLPRRDRPWAAGVNSFGFGGANAHVTLMQAPPETAPAAHQGEDRASALILSAATETALRQLASAWRDRLADADAETAADLLGAAAHRRARHGHRLIVAETEPERLRIALEAAASGARPSADLPRWIGARAIGATPAPVAFLFSGNGSQWAGMARHALAEDAAFRAGFEAVASAVRAEGGPDLLEALAAPDLEVLLAQALVAQPLLIAVQVGLVEGLAQRGVRPAAVCGHSVGEVTAAWACGALTMQQMVRLAMRRARRQAPLFGTGSMAAVAAGVADVEALIAEAGIAEIAIAADNSPRGCTVSGPRAALDALAAATRRRRMALRKLKVEYPFHGPMMERIEADLRADLADLAPGTPAVPFFSTVTGAEMGDAPLDADYWWRNARQPVLFRQAVSALSEAGFGVCLEIGPQPSLHNYVTDTLQPSGRAHAALSSFRRQGVGAEDIDLIAAQVIAAGGAIDETPLLGRFQRPAPDLPAYPWDARRFEVATSPDALNVFRRQSDRALLGWTARSGDAVWYLTLDPAMQPWLADHRLDGAVVVPAAALAEIALAAGAEGIGGAGVELADFDVPRPVTLDGGDGRELRTTLDTTTGAIRIEGRAVRSTEAWTLHAQGTLRRSAAPVSTARLPDRVRLALTKAEAEGPDEAADALYAGLERLGLGYGPAFRRVAAATQGETAEEAVGRLAASALPGDWAVDPTALDAAFHLVAAVLKDSGAADADGLCHVPVRIARLRSAVGGGAAVFARARITRQGARTIVADIALFDAGGACTALAEGVRFAAIALRRRAEPASLFWREQSQPLQARVAALPSPWGDAPQRLEALGLACDGASAPEAEPAALVIDAACRRIVWDAARHLAPEGGLSFRARRLLAPQARRALERGLAALAQDGVYDPVADTIADEIPLPPLETLLGTLCAVAPERATAIAGLSGLAARLIPGPDTEARDLAALTAALAADRAGDAALWAPLTAAATDLLGAADAQAPHVAVIGAMPASMGKALAGAGRLDQAPGLTEADAAALEAMVARGPVALLLLGPCLAVDPRVAASVLPRLLMPGGLLLAVDPGRDLLGDLLADLAGDDPLDMAAIIAGAGLEPNRLPLSDVSGASVLTARQGAETVAAPTQPRRIALLSDADTPLGAALTVALEQGGHVVRTMASVDTAEPGELLVLLPGAQADAASAAPSATVAARLVGLREVMQAAPDSPILVVTRGAVEGTSPEDAALSRALRVLANERPDRRLVSVDICPTLEPEDAAEALGTALAADDLPGEIAIGSAGPGVPRIAAAGDVAERAALAAAGPEPAMVLATDPQGGIAALRWQPVPRRTPGDGEVEIAVRATGLNFRDVMWAMGALPEEAIEQGFSGSGFGMEAAGVVTRAGPGVSLAPGTRVVAFASGAMATHVTLPAKAVAEIPDAVPFAAAASLPVAFATAWHGLVTLGALQAGETVLIHGAVGGVGMAAIQIARERGARVLATAGSAQRRLLAEQLGADAAFDSRSLDFAEDVLAATGGQGVDVVLNSLSGAAMERSLDLLRPFGRFVELGKRDYYAGTRISLRPMRRNIAYFGVDLDALLGARPDAAEPLLREMVRRMETGALPPLPHRRFEAEAVQDAVRLMQRAGHVGKIVVTPPPEPLPWNGAPAVRADAAYLVVGGLGGFGLKLAEHLAAQGATHLWLTGRSGVASDAAVPERLHAAGVTVEAVACDAADEAGMRALLARIAESGRPLAGVVHAAMVLDDALFDGLSSERIAAVLRPKIDAAVLLDRLTRSLQVERFVLLSSIAAMIGNPGQIAYVAANAGIEAVARARRRDGLPALAVALGPIADAGALVEDPRLRERLERAGAGLMSSAQALAAIETALAGQGPEDHVLTAAPVRWPLLARELPLVAGPLFERLDRTLDTVAAAGAVDIAELIAGKDNTAALAAIVDLLRAEAAQILRQPPGEIDPSRPLGELGFDSLMAVELKLAAEDKYRLDLPVTALSDGMTLTGVAARLLATLRREGDETEAGASDELVATMAQRHLGAEHGDLVSRADDGAVQSATAEPAP